MDMLERERSENAELRSRIQRLDAQYNAFVSGEQELIELNERLEREVDELRSQLEKLRESSQKDLEHADQLVASSRSAWTEEKCHLQSRVDELDVQLSSALKKLTTATASYKQVFFKHVYSHKAAQKEKAQKNSNIQPSLHIHQISGTPDQQLNTYSSVG